MKHSLALLSRDNEVGKHRILRYRVQRIQQRFCIKVHAIRRQCLRPGLGLLSLVCLELSPKRPSLVSSAITPPHPERGCVQPSVVEKVHIIP